MDKHQYLHIDSCHPFHCKASIPCSQALHLQQIFLKEKKIIKELAILCKVALTSVRPWWEAVKYRMTKCYKLPGRLAYKTKQHQDMPARILFYTISSLDHQETSAHSSCLGTNKGGGISNSTINGLLSSDKSKRLPGSSSSYIYATWATRQLTLWSSQM